MFANFETQHDYRNRKNRATSQQKSDENMKFEDDDQALTHDREHQCYGCGLSVEPARIEALIRHIRCNTCQQESEEKAGPFFYS